VFDPLNSFIFIYFICKSLQKCNLTSDLHLRKKLNTFLSRKTDGYTCTCILKGKIMLCLVLFPYALVVKDKLSSVMAHLLSIHPVSIQPCDLVGRAFTPSLEGRGFECPVRSSQRLKHCHLLFPWLVFTI